MNNLSLFLYATGVVGTLGSFLAGGLVACAAWWLFIKGMCSNSDPGEYFSDASNFKKAPLYVILLVIAIILLPSQRTMYMILGSEVGEEVVQSETAMRVKSLVDKKLDEYLADTAK